MGLFSSAKKRGKSMRIDPHGLFKADAEQLARLEGRGVDPAAPREIEFAVCFSDQPSADAAAASLRGDRVRHEVVLPSHDIPEWTIMLVSRNQPLLPDFLRERVDLCTALADAHKGQYEGWVALLTDQEKAAE